MVIWLNEDHKKGSAKPLNGSKPSSYYRRSFLSQGEADVIISMKSKPLVEPLSPTFEDNAKKVGLCCGCLEKSTKLCNRNFYQLYGWRNILNCPSNLYSRTYFYDFIFSVFQNHSHQYLDVKCRKIADLRLDDRVVHNNESIIKKCMKSVETTFSMAFIRFVGYVFFKVFPMISRGILVDEGRIRAIKDASNYLARQSKPNGQQSPFEQTLDRCPCVFLPLHTSHLDYLILALVAFCFDFPLPYVGAGNNLDIPIVKYAIKRTGGFFIKRGQIRQPSSLNSGLSSYSFASLPTSEVKNGNGSVSARSTADEDDVVSKAVLRWILKELLSNNQSVEFYIEGTRTRNGRPCSPRIGLLSLLIDCLDKNEIPDVCIVPTCLSYERVWELDDLVAEQLGKEKSSENLWSSLKAGFNLLFSYCGLIRVDFGEPFSLKDFIERSQSYQTTNNLTNIVVARNSTTSPIASLPTSVVTAASLLAQHVIFDCNRIAPITLTSAISFLLIKKFRRGESIKVITKALLHLRKEILERGYDVTFSDDDEEGMSEAVIFGVHILRKFVAQEKVGDDLFICPSSELRDVLALNYCAGRVLVVFAAEAVVATSFVAATKLNETTTVEEGDADADTQFRMDKNVLLERAEVLCHLLAKELIFVPPCRSLTSELDGALDRLMKNSILRYRDAPTRPFVNPEIVQHDGEDESDFSDSEEQELGYFDGDDDEENGEPGEVVAGGYYRSTTASKHVETGPIIELNLMNATRALKKLLDLHNFVKPILESQWVTACNVASFVDEPSLLQRDREFVTLCQRDAIDTFGDGNITFKESASLTTISNAVKCFEHFGFLSRRSLGDRRGIYIELGQFASRHIDSNVVEGLISLLEYYRVFPQSEYPRNTSHYRLLIDHILTT